MPLSCCFPKNLRSPGGRPPEDEETRFKLCYDLQKRKSASTVHDQFQQGDAGVFPRLGTATSRGQGVEGPMTKAPPGAKAPRPHPHDKTQLERTHRAPKRSQQILTRWEKKVENYRGFIQGTAAHLCMRACLPGGGVPLKQHLTTGISRNRASGTRGANFPLASSPGYDYLGVTLSSGIRRKPP